MVYQLRKIMAHQIVDQDKSESFASTALHLIRENCFKIVQNRVQEAFFDGLQRDRDNEAGVDLSLV